MSDENDEAMCDDLTAMGEAASDEKNLSLLEEAMLEDEEDLRLMVEVEDDEYITWEEFLEMKNIDPDSIRIVGFDFGFQDCDVYTVTTTRIGGGDD